MIRTNLIGTLFMCKAIGSYMKEQKSGRIINIGSIAGMVGRDRRMYYKADKMEQPVDYAAAKSGVIAMTRDLAAVDSHPLIYYVDYILLLPSEKRGSSAGSGKRHGH